MRTLALCFLFAAAVVVWPHSLWADSAQNNVLLLIADDLGAERVTGFTEWVNSDAAAVDVPTLNRLAKAGLTFSRAWSYPTCSPTRASLMTGLYSNSLGILSPLPSSLPGHLADVLGTNIALPKTFPAVPAGLFGKWHVSTETDDPVVCGFDRFVGFIKETDVTSYTDWTKYEDDGSIVDHTSNYITTYLVDQATSWIKEQSQAGKAWFAEVAFSAPHGTEDSGGNWVWNESDLSSACVTLPKTDLNDSQVYDLQVQCLDSEIGRLLDQIGALGSHVLEHTTIIFIGDNGTPGQVAVSPLSKDYAKGTVYQGGVHVPMIIADGQYLVPGAAINVKRTGTVVSPGRTVHSLAQVADLYPTIRDILHGASAGTINGVSLVPYMKSASSTSTRSVMTTAAFQDDVYWEAATDGQYKLLRKKGKKDATFADFKMFNLTTDAWEGTDVLGASKTNPSYTVLTKALEALSFK
jgi:arylsulfatase B